jgi:NAD(P) transhydrogenase subunit alpha
MTASIAYKQASDIADKAASLVDTLKGISIDSSNEVGGDLFIYAFTIFVLSCFIGYYVVWRVTPALHTPLMSITNAISGIIVIGGMIAASSPEFCIASACGYIAVFLASINVFGGFVVTERMLDMFKKK